MSEQGETAILRRATRWLRWRWHLLRWRNRDATWHVIHSYGCDVCEDQ